MKRIKTIVILLLISLIMISCNEKNINASEDTTDMKKNMTDTTIDTDAADTTEVTTAETTAAAEETTEPVYESKLTFLRDKDTFTARCQAVYTVPKVSDTIKTCQGGHIVGDIVYQAMLQRDDASNQADNKVVIIKANIKTKEVLAKSEVLKLNHANDITYNPKTNSIIVVHNAPNNSQVSFLNADTLKFEKTVDIGQKIYCMEYNEKYDKYVIGLSGGQSFMFLDGDFNRLSKPQKPTTRTNGYVTQGMCCDDDFIYFVLYKENVITVYDWDGAFVTIIEIGMSGKEPENLSVVDGQIYVTFHTSDGAFVTKLVSIK